MKLKFYYCLCLVLLLGLGIIACTRDDSVNTEPQSQEELLQQKAEIWYQQNLDFAIKNKSSGIDINAFRLNWDRKEFIKNQSGNTIISVPVEGVIPGYALGVMNFLLTQEGESQGVYKVYKEDPYQQNTEMAFYSGTGQLIVQGYYNYKRGTFIVPEVAYNPVAGIYHTAKKGKGEVEEREIEEVIITKPRPPQPKPPIPWIPPTNPAPRPPDSGFPATPGGGGGGPNPNQEIINNLKQYPCAQKLLEQLPSLDNSFAKLIETMFKNNDKVKVTFSSKDFGNSKLEGHFIEDKNKTQKTGILHFDIELSTKILKNSTQEYVLSVMYHEFVHAYLTHEWITLSRDEYHQKYPYFESYVVDGVQKFKFIPGDHQAFSPFINMIADGILAYNSNFPKKLATDLAMGGLTEDADEGVGTRQNERESNRHALGTKCSKP
ncbi:hypothetical protein [Elizabethkingia meningoseptica]|uniref:hypothetical protein n=1 Tax=Elizabethkingia meningoseptica TaxID=238 RepID=UPI003891782B